MATDEQKVNTDEVNRSVDEWRRSQGLPAIDRSKDSRTLEASKEATKPKEAKRG